MNLKKNALLKLLPHLSGVNELTLLMLKSIFWLVMSNSFQYGKSQASKETYISTTSAEAGIFSELWQHNGYWCPSFSCCQAIWSYGDWMTEWVSVKLYFLKITSDALGVTICLHYIMLCNGVGGAVRFLVVGAIGKEERPPPGQLWMEQYLISLKYWPI